MEEPVNVRKYIPDDLADLEKIAVAAWEPVFASIREMLGDPIFTHLHPDWRQEKKQQIRQACKDKHAAAVLVAEIHNQIVGFATCYTKPQIKLGEIGNNAVHPDYQNRGIAQALYAEVFDELRRRGIQIVMVGTGLDSSHAPARRAYEKAGFIHNIPGVEYYKTL